MKINEVQRASDSPKSPTVPKRFPEIKSLQTWFAGIFLLDRLRKNRKIGRREKG